MYQIDLRGKTAVVFGVANQRSIASAIASILHDAGAQIVADALKMNQGLKVLELRGNDFQPL